METKFNTKENIVKCSLQCSTRTEFRKRYPGAYLWARRLSILDEVCSHMIIRSYSTPQLMLKIIFEEIFGIRSKYNDRILIKPYEIDVYFSEFKIGFEYDGKRWHRSEKINKTKLCEEKEVLLITLIENNRDYEVDIKHQICNHLDKINDWCCKCISEEDILNVKIDHSTIVPNLEKIKEITLKYNDVSVFIKNEPSLYSLLSRNKLINKFTSHMFKKRKNYTTIDIDRELNKHKDLNDLIENNNPLYLYIRRHKLSHKIYEKFGKPKRWTKHEIIEEIKKYKTLKEFKSNTGGCENAARRFNLQSELNSLKPKKKIYHIIELTSTISKYNKLIDLIKHDRDVYNYCYYNKLEHLYSHLEKRRHWSYNELFEIVKTCNTVKELSIKNYNAYVVIRKRYKSLLSGLKKYIK